jgi:N utilization substance protein A
MSESALIHTTGVEISVFARKTIVSEMKDHKNEELLETAKLVNPNYQVGDVIEQKYAQRFWQNSAQTAKQVVVQRLREAERGLV